ncbi:MAG: hypothetical protein PVI21_04600 [Candidatus Woesebacteria bacterium]|jgi:hypothetical protein
MQQSDAANKFVDKILEQKGVDGVDENIVKQMREDLLSSLDAMINKAIIDSLSAEQRIKLEHLIDTNQIDKVQSYVQSVGVNVSGIVARCMMQIQRDYLGV